jgi:hypothetical protein
MTEEEYIELCLFIESYEKRAKIDKTKFSEQVYEESKKRIKNYKDEKL